MTVKYPQFSICPVKCIWLPFITYPLTCWMVISDLTCPKQFAFPTPLVLPWLWNPFVPNIFHFRKCHNNSSRISSQKFLIPHILLVNNVISFLKVYWNSNQISPSPPPPPTPKHPHCGGHRGVLIGHPSRSITTDSLQLPHFSVCKAMPPQALLVIASVAGEGGTSTGSSLPDIDLFTGQLLVRTPIGLTNTFSEPCCDLITPLLSGPWLLATAVWRLCLPPFASCPYILPRDLDVSCNTQSCLAVASQKT